MAGTDEVVEVERRAPFDVMIRMMEQSRDDGAVLVDVDSSEPVTVEGGSQVSLTITLEMSDEAAGKAKDKQDADNDGGNHTHGGVVHSHAFKSVAHNHMLRAICQRPECAGQPTHNIHHGPPQGRRTGEPELLAEYTKPEDDDA
jgi:hypothetical protein